MIPGDGGSKMRPEGLLFEDLGPNRIVGQGIKETKVLEERVRKRAAGGCPFVMAGKA